MCRDNALHCLSVSDYRSTCSSESKVMTSCTTCVRSEYRKTSRVRETPKKKEQDLHLRLHRPQWAGEMFKFMTQSEKDWSSVDCYQPVLSENNMQSCVCSDLHAPLNADSDLANLYLWRTTEAIREEESAISDAVLSLFFSYHGNAEEEQHHYSQYWLISWGTEKSHYTNMITQRRKCD